MSLLVLDLIDTLWNVKASVKVVVSDKSVDLIDTLWNVKIPHKWVTLYTWTI